MYRNNFGYGYGGWSSPSGFGQSMYNQPSLSFDRFQNQSSQQFDSGPAQKPILQVPWVNGEVGAQAYFMPPNSAVLLMDSDNARFYIKTSDPNGKATIKSFKYEEIVCGADRSDTTAYVTKEEFERFKASLVVPNSQEDKNEPLTRFDGKSDRTAE